MPPARQLVPERSSPTRAVHKIQPEDLLGSVRHPDVEAVAVIPLVSDEGAAVVALKRLRWRRLLRDQRRGENSDRQQQRDTCFAQEPAG